MSQDKKDLLKSRILNYLTNPVFLSLFFGSVIIFNLPNLFNKYKADFIKREKALSNHYIYYNDFNNDGQYEKIDIISPWDGRTAVLIYSNGKILDQFNFDGEFVNITAAFFADVDNNGCDEIFIFTWQNNRILLNCFNPISKKILIRNRFISEYYKINNAPDFGVYPCGCYDINADKWKEFYFSIISGFSAYPRKMLALDIVNDSLYSSPEGCINILYPFCSDLDKDGNLEFSGTSQAVGNCDSTESLSDFYLWLTVFTKTLEYKFKPIKIGRHPSRLNVITVKTGQQTLLAALNIYVGNKNLPCSIGIYDAEGRRIRQKLFDFSEDWAGASLMINESNNQRTFYIIKRNGQIEEWDVNLNLIALQKINPVCNTKYHEIDINNDHEKASAFLLKDRDHTLIMRRGFRYPLIIDVAGNSFIHYISGIGKGPNGTKLFIVGNTYHYYYDYYENPLYYFKYLVYAGIYLMALLLLLLIQKAQKYRYEQKYKAEKKIAELQIKSIKNQLDPHFTFNILNSIGSLFQKQDREKADYIFGKYSKLLRETVLNSDKIETLLIEELDYVKNYLDLEKYRLSDSFEYEINNNEFDAGGLKIPKMLIHTFVENAVKHGLRHLKKEGRLIIDVCEENNSCLIKIDDNGVGREKAKTLSPFSTGKGLKVLDQILDLYQNLENIKITYSIKDKFDKSRNPLGTEVSIRIPFHG